MRKFLVLILLFAITFGLVVNIKGVTSNIYYKFVSDNDGLYGSDVSCIEIDANNPNIIYVGTRSEGIFVSTDSGHNWKWIGKGFEVNLPDYRKTYYEIFSIKTIKGKPGLIYVATYGGLFVSTDGGMNFILNRSLNRKTFSLYISPDNPNYLIVGTDNGIYISNDGGKTFEEKNNNITNISVFSILKDSSMKDAYYIGTDKGIFKTLDNCDTWLLLPNGISGTIYGITQHPNKPYIIYAASSIGIYITYDYGDHWGNLTDKFIPALKSYSVYVDSFNDRLVLAITVKGVILSNDGGNTWSTMIQAFPETQINCGIPVDLQFTKIYLGTRIGFAVYENKALSFYNNGLGLLDISAVGYDQNYGYLYAESRLGLYTKLSQGNLWNYLSGALYGANAHSFAVDPTVPNSMFAATYYGIMWSTNNGKDWSLTNLTSSEFFSVTFSKANPKYVFAGGYGGLYMSKDSGYNFSRILYNFEVPIYSVVAPSSQSIFVLTKSYIYKSDDLGKTFTIINDKVKNLNPTVLAGDFNDPSVF
ncbi:MAG: hypothetical protein OH363_06110, partial [Candidatus Parvarchaeota archaeon]|nr:hypothetical protein [Candidatus Jingweiarchaeum tengchongense]